MSSVEEVKEAAAKYEEFVANLKEAEEVAAQEEAEELASMPSGVTQNGGTGAPEHAYVSLLSERLTLHLGSQICVLGCAWCPQATQPCLRTLPLL